MPGSPEALTPRAGRRLRGGLAVVLLAGVLVACDGGGPATGAPPDPPADTIPASETVAFVDVDVVPMDAPLVLHGQTVVTQGGRILMLGPSGDVEVPAAARVIDGSGRWLVPGLADMHVHMERADVAEYLRYGITSVRNMWGTPSVAGLAAEIEDGELAGPTIYSTSPGLDGTPPTWPFTRVVLDPADAEAAVAEQQAEGWRAIKVYQQLTRDVYTAIVDAAAARNLPVMGHVPHRVGLEGVLEARQHSIEHLGGIAEHVTTVGGRGTQAWRAIDETKVSGAATMIRQAGTWVCPTLAVHRVLMQRYSASEQEAIVRNQQRVLRELAAMNVGLLVGTDSGIDATQPGISLHDELAEWVSAGLEPYQALRAATADAARFLGEEAEFGQVAIGMRADLVLVSGNPLEDVRVLAAPDGVMLRGAWLPAGR